MSGLIKVQKLCFVLQEAVRLLGWGWGTGRPGDAEGGVGGWRGVWRVERWGEDSGGDGEPGREYPGLLIHL